MEPINSDIDHINWKYKFDFIWLYSNFLANTK